MGYYDDLVNQQAVAQTPQRTSQQTPKQGGYYADLVPKPTPAKPSTFEKIKTFLGNASKVQEAHLGEQPMEQPIQKLKNSINPVKKELKGVKAAVKSGIETIKAIPKAIPQIPGQLVKGVQETERKQRELATALRTKDPKRFSLIKKGAEETAERVADIGSIGLGPAGFATTRGAKYVGKRKAGVTPEEAGKEIGEDVASYATLFGIRKVLGKFSKSPIRADNKGIEVTVDPKGIKDLFRKVGAIGGGTAEERAIFQSLSDTGQLRSALQSTKPLKIRIPKTAYKAPTVPSKPVKPTIQKGGLPTKIEPKAPIIQPKLPTVEKPLAQGKPLETKKVAGMTDELPLEPQRKFVPKTQLPETYKTTYQKNIDILKTSLKSKRPAFLKSAYYDVEKPFRDANAPKTGLAIKTMMSKMSIGEEKALDFARKINTLGLDKKELRNLAFIAEDKKLLQHATPKQKQAAEVIKKELDADLATLKQRGILKTGFPDSMIERLNDQKLELQGKKGNMMAIANINKKLEILKDVQYVPIQLKILLEDELKERLSSGQSLEGLPTSEGPFASFKKLKGRKSLTLKNLVKEGIIPKEKVDARILIGTYKRYINNKLAEKDIVDMAIKEKLAVPITADPPDNFVDIPTRHIPDLKGYKIDPVFADYLTDMFKSVHGNRGMISKATSIVKMMQFYNPLFLPLNDITQAAMLGSLQTTQLPKYMRQSYEMITKRTPEYYDALATGLASTPNKNPFQVFRDDIAKVTAETNSVPSRMLSALKRYGKTAGTDIIRDLYNLSWGIAWKLDKSVRFVSYNYLRDQGLSVEDAAQVAAAYHGDYAGVPAKTRRELNNVLFTPTFKISMTKLYGSMLKGAAQQAGGKDWKKQGGGKGKAFGKGLLWTTAVIMGRRLFMKKLGFKEEEFNRKYSLEADTSKGKRKITLSFADPTNIPWRYYYRFGVMRPEDLNIPHKWARGASYELNPLWRIGISLINNRKGNGKNIYKRFDDFQDQIKDISQYTIGETVGILKPLMKRKTKEDMLLKEAIKNSAYPLLLNAMKVYSFQYGGDLDFTRNAKALQRLKNEFQREERKFFIEGDTKGIEKRLKNFEKRFIEVAERGNK